MTVIPQLERQLAAATRRRRRRAVQRGAAAAVVGVAVAAALALPALLDSGDAPRHAPATPRPQPAEPRLEDLLGVFRRERTPRDDTGSTIADLEASHDRQPGEDPTRSRRIDLSSGPVYLWPTKDGVCSSWGNCLHLSLLAKLGVALGIEGGGGRLVISGIVVDGIDQVQLGPEDGDQFVIPVKDNVFRVDASRLSPRPTRLLWSDSRGRHRQEFPPLP